MVWENEGATLSDIGFDTATGTVASDTTLTITESPSAADRALVVGAVFASATQDFQWELRFGAVVKLRGDGTTGFPSGVALSQALEAPAGEDVSLVVTTSVAGRIKGNFTFKEIGRE